MSCQHLLEAVRNNDSARVMAIMKAELLGDDGAVDVCGGADSVRMEEAIRAFQEGQFLVVVDAMDRENEGDLIIAAEHLTSDKMAFMVRYTSGLICAPATQERLKQLGLPLMVPSTNNTESHGTAYTISCDLRHGTTTGISAADRAATIRAMSDLSFTDADFARPGHVFPLQARSDGVLEREGHTEASIDLCRLAGLQPVAAISEIVRYDGSMMRTNELRRFAKRHGLYMISIEELKAYHQKHGFPVQEK